MTQEAVEQANATDFFSAAQVIIVAGKGGVGKTTVSAALGTLSARLGFETVVIDVEDRDDLGRCFGFSELNFEPTVAGPNLQLRSLGAEDAATEYLKDQGLGRVLKLLRRAGSLLDTLTSLTPGLRGMLQLAKIRSIADASPNAVIIVDAPAAGHAISFLRSPLGLREGITAGPIHKQATAASELLGDPDRTQVMLVTLAEDTPVQETIETAYALEEDLSIRLGPIVVNTTVPVIAGLGKALSATARKSSHKKELAEAGDLRHQRQEHQREQIEFLAQELPLPTVQLPELLTPSISKDELSELADLLANQLRLMP